MDHVSEWADVIRAPNYEEAFQAWCRSNERRAGKYLAMVGVDYAAGRMSLRDGPTTMDEVLRVVGAVSGVSIREMLGRWRNKRAVLARQSAMYLCRTLGSDCESFPQIARHFGRDHSTVFHACASVEANPDRYAGIIEPAKKALGVE